MTAATAKPPTAPPSPAHTHAWDSVGVCTAITGRVVSLLTAERCAGCGLERHRPLSFAYAHPLQAVASWCAFGGVEP